MSVASHASIRRRLGVIAAAVLVVAGMSVPATAFADEPTNMVLVWNENAVSVISNPVAPVRSHTSGAGRAPRRSPPSASAMVQGAVYDAVNAIDKGHEPYLDGSERAVDARRRRPRSPRRHTTSCWVSWPRRRGRGRQGGRPARPRRWRSSTMARPRPTASRSAHSAAAAMLAARTGDGRFDVEPFVRGDDPGEWRAGAAAERQRLRPVRDRHAPHHEEPGQFRTEGPLDLTSAEYAAEFNEVKALGAQSGSSRTPEQTLLAGFVTANPLLLHEQGSPRHRRRPGSVDHRSGAALREDQHGIGRCA